MRAAMPLMLFSLLLLELLSTRKIEVPTMFFGSLLDKYTFEESKEDGATLQILYEDRMPELFVEWVNTIDQIFERVFADLDKETKDKLKTVCYQRENC
jgi:type I site-specific restriction-modification system R (restriction) subunit